MKMYERSHDICLANCLSSRAKQEHRVFETGFFSEMLRGFFLSKAATSCIQNFSQPLAFFYIFSCYVERVKIIPEKLGFVSCI
jgi:hypothetical protein